MTPDGRRRARAARSALIASLVIASLALMAPPALADDAVTPPAAAPTAAPTVEPGPEPAPADPAPAEPTAEPAPAEPAPTEPVALPSRLPLREGATGWRVRQVQKRLQWLGYEIYEGNLANERLGTSTAAAVEEFQGKFGYRPTGVVGQGTWELLDRIAGRVGRVPAGCRGETTICIDKSQRLVRLVAKDAVVLTLDARFGFVGAETREGTFRVQSKSRDHVSSLYRTWMPFALFFSGGQAVHYSPYFARDGYRGGSHGCVNLRDYEAARWLFDRVPVGTRVHVYRS